jgi:hypothetical protein
MILLALSLTLIIAIAALAIDAGLDFVDQRRLQQASDLGALGGAGTIGTGGFSASLQTLVLTTAQAYAWQNLDPSPPVVTCAGAQLVGNVCTVTGTNYTVRTTYPYTPQQGQPYPALNSVAVDVDHNYTTPGFTSAIGVNHACTGPQYSGGNVCVRTHSAAVAKSGSSNFPFALATRYLEVQGSSSTTVFGSSLIYQCAGDGTGSFVDNSQNGGLLTNGGSKFAVGQATAGGVVTSPAALLVANPNGVSCAGNTNQNPVSNWSVLGDRACFQSSCPGYNAAFAFNYNATPPGWDDHCWQGGNAGDVLVSSSPPSFEANTGVVTAGSPAPCTRSGNPPSYEGSFLNQDGPGFPNFLPPSGALSTSLGINAPTTTFTSSPPSGKYAPGWYVFDGVGASLDGNGRTIGCNQPVAADKIQGCVFTFRNGAHLDLSHGTIACGTASSGHCAFEFGTPVGGNSSYLSVAQSTTVDLLPVSISRVDPATGVASSFNLPIIFSSDNTRCVGSGTNGAMCAVLMSQSNAFNVGGTIFVPHGIVNIKANASPASGQLIADTVLLQGGSSSGGGAVAYRGNLNSPIPGPAALFE